MKRLLSLFCVAVLVLLSVQAAFGWANATHTYFANALGSKYSLQNLNEMYGAVLPDAFNTTLMSNAATYLVGKYLDDHTHVDFMPVVKNAWRCELKAVAFGFTSHNDKWGADWTAHHDGRMTSGGWVIEKAELMRHGVEDVIHDILNNASVPEPAATLIATGAGYDLSHNLVEVAVDALVRQNLDREIGLRMLLAAKLRALDTPLLLSSAYACGLARDAHISVLDATRIIVGAEKQYRDYCLQYGQAFCLPDDQIIPALAMQGAAFAKGALENAQVALGIRPPHPVTVDPTVVAGFIGLARVKCLESPTYAEELSATLAYLKNEMKVVPTCSGWFAKGEAGEEPDAASATTPVEFSLGDNYPNPFNPTTTITYSVPSDCQITLKIYNSLGQEVATLVDGEMVAGRYQVNWDASGVASGVYFYRLIAGSNSAMKRMLVLK